MRWNFGNAALRHSALLGSIVLWRTTTPSPHSDLFPLDARDIVGFILAILSLLVAAGGGIGGGALLVPICLIVLGAHSARRFSALSRPPARAGTALPRFAVLFDSTQVVLQADPYPCVRKYLG